LEVLSVLTKINFDSFSRFFEIVIENFDIEEIIYLVIAGTIFLLCYYATIHCICAVVRAKEKAKKIVELMETVALLLCVSTLCAFYIYTQIASISNQ